MSQGPNLYNYVKNNPINLTDSMGMACGDENTWDWMDMLYGFTDFSAGFGDMFTFGIGRLLRNASGNDIVNTNSVSYVSGEVAGFATSAVVTVPAAGLEASGYSTRLAIHEAHHSFGSLGKLSHVQLNIWKAGVKGSGQSFRVPLPWR